MMKGKRYTIPTNCATVLPALVSLLAGTVSFPGRSGQAGHGQAFIYRGRPSLPRVAVAINIMAAETLRSLNASHAVNSGNI